MNSDRPGQPNTGPLAVLFYELDAGLAERLLQKDQGAPHGRALVSLEITDRHDAHLGLLSELPLGPAEKSARAATLFWGDHVAISGTPSVLAQPCRLSIDYISCRF